MKKRKLEKKEQAMDIHEKELKSKKEEEIEKSTCKKRDFLLRIKSRPPTHCISFCLFN